MTDQPSGDTPAAAKKPRKELPLVSIPQLPESIKLALLPEQDSTVKRSQWARVLLLGPPKTGKTTISGVTCPQPAYIINSDQSDALVPIRDWIEDHPELKGRVAFTHNLVHDTTAMEAAIVTAATMVKYGTKTVIWDTISGFSELLAVQCEQANAKLNESGKPDGRKYWPDYEKRLKNYVNRLLRLPAHVIITAHFMDFTTEADDKASGKKIAKVGEGIVPLLYGRARLSIAGLFSHVVYLDMSDRDGSRALLTSTKGVWGPGSRYSTKGITKFPPNMRIFFKHLRLGT